MKIAFFELEEWEKNYFKEQLGNTFQTQFFESTTSHEGLGKIQDVEILVVFINSQLNKETLSQLPQLKSICTMSTGIDHIDLEECKKRGIVVSNVPTYGENTVAEHTFALLLALSRKIIESHERVKECKFDPKGLTGFDLYGKTIGVVGVGNIGSHVVRIARGIGMEVLGYKRTPDPKLEQELQFKFVDVDTLLSSSDVISLHLPYTPETHHFLNAEQFAKMKQGVIIINTARGALIDTTALLDALNSGKVSAAGLDVLEEEVLLKEEKELLSKGFEGHSELEMLCVVQDHVLLTHSNVLVTPHNAFNSREALDKIVKTTEENITAFAKGNPINVV